MTSLSKLKEIQDRLATTSTDPKWLNEGLAELQTLLEAAPEAEASTGPHWLDSYQYSVSMVDRGSVEIMASMMASMSGTTLGADGTIPADVGLKIKQLAKLANVAAVQLVLNKYTSRQTLNAGIAAYNAVVAASMPDTENAAV